jgi:hypothetical protein
LEVGLSSVVGGGIPSALICSGVLTGPTCSCVTSGFAAVGWAPSADGVFLLFVLPNPVMPLHKSLNAI